MNEWHVNRASVQNQIPASATKSQLIRCYFMYAYIMSNNIDYNTNNMWYTIFIIKTFVMKNKN